MHEPQTNPAALVGDDAVAPANDMCRRPAAGGASRSAIWFINRSFWPDAEATGQLLTELCDDLAAPFDVHVVTGQPNSNPANEPFQRRGAQRRNGVDIHRT